MVSGNNTRSPTTRAKSNDAVDRINEIADEINAVLDDRKRDKYFESITLLYSFIENVLKWLVYTNALWKMSEKVIPVKGVKAARDYCKGLSFYQASNLAYLVGGGWVKGNRGTRKQREKYEKSKSNSEVASRWRSSMSLKLFL